MYKNLPVSPQKTAQLMISFLMLEDDNSMIQQEILIIFQDKLLTNITANSKELLQRIDGHMVHFRN